MARLKAIADTGPLISAVIVRERAHAVARELVAALGRSLLVPVPVAVEADHILRQRVGGNVARAFLGSLAAGEHQLEPLSIGLFRRAVRFDERFADLHLGLADASVMAAAEHHDLPILTFDFADFRAAPSTDGPWPLVIDERQLARAMGEG